MPDLNDFNAFKSTGGGSSNGDGCGIGCLSPTAIIIGIIIFLIYLIGKL